MSGSTLDDTVLLLTIVASACGCCGGPSMAMRREVAMAAFATSISASVAPGDKDPTAVAELT